MVTITDEQIAVIANTVEQILQSRQPKKGTYDCSEKWANCPAGKPHCYWGDRRYNEGKCCIYPWSTVCVSPGYSSPTTSQPTTSPSKHTSKPSKHTTSKPSKHTSKPSKHTTSKPSKHTSSEPVPVAGGSWKKATATWYSSYPECCHDKKADQSECEDYSGCKYEGMFAAFDGKKSKEWVQQNNIVAFYESPNSSNRKEWGKKWKNKKIRLRNPKTGKTLDATVVDTCDDKDCSGCCTKNAKKNGGYLVDLEANTAKRFYGGKPVDMAGIEWQLI